MPKQTQYYLNALFLLVLLGAATVADAQVDQQRAQAYFKEAQALCERDGGRLWTFKAAPGGWVVREGPRRGDFEVVRKQP